MAWTPEEELARLRAMGIGTGEGFGGSAPVVGGLGIGNGPMIDAVQGGLEPAPSGGFWGGVQRFASAAAPYVKQGVGFAGDVAMNLASGDPNTATRGRLAINEGQQRGAALALQESRDRIEAQREFQKQRVYDAMQQKPPQTREEAMRYATMLGPYDPRMASALMQQFQAQASKTRSYPRGSETVTEEVLPDGSVRELSVAPRWNPAGSSIDRLAAAVAANAVQPTNSIASEAQKKVLDTTGTLSRLSEIRAMYRPEYQQIPTQLKAAGISWADRFGAEIPEESRALLDSYTEYRAASFDHMSTILNLLSGAAISPAEQKRLEMSLPDANGDSPTEFEAKLNRSERTARLALIRYSYSLKAGIPVDAIPLTTDRLKQKIGETAEAEAKKAGKSQADAEAAGAKAVQDAFSGL